MPGTRKVGRLARAAALMAALALRAAMPAGVWPGGSVEAASSRTVVVIGDLHLGLGRATAGGGWHSLEDFRWDDEFVGFVGAVETAARDVDLVLNGDAFGLWQSDETECGDETSGCDAQEASARLRRVIDAHAPVIDRLAAFSRTGSNRVTFVPGDHDAALLLPEVGRLLNDAFSSRKGRIELALTGGWWSDDGEVYVEHGHQMPRSTYRFGSWPEPFTRRGERTAMARTPGEWLIQSLYNRVETQYPLIDDFAEDGAGVKYALSADPTLIPPSHALDVARFLLSKPTWQQFRKDLESTIETSPTWDLDRVRALGISWVVDSFAADDPIRPWIEKGLAGSAQERVGLSGFSDEELTAICDYRAAVRRARRRMEPDLTQMAPTGRAVGECPRTADTVGGVFGYFWGSRDREVRARLDEILATAQVGGSRPTPKAFIYGHTHVVDRGFTIQHEKTPVQVANPGAWLRTITPARAEELKSERGWSDADLLQRLDLKELPACYGYVWIPPYKDAPQPQVRAWQQGSDGKWALGGRCP